MPRVCINHAERRTSPSCLFLFGLTVILVHTYLSSKSNDADYVSVQRAQLTDRVKGVTKVIVSNVTYHNASKVSKPTGIKNRTKTHANSNFQSDYAIPISAQKAQLTGHARVVANVTTRNVTVHKSSAKKNITNTKKRLKMDCACAQIKKGRRCSSCVSLEYEDFWENLKYTKILLIGDSLPGQLHKVMTCSAPKEYNIKIVYKYLPVFPFEEMLFEDILKQMFALDDWSAVVVGIGSWYNWDWSERTSLSRVDGKTTLRLLQQHCPKDLYGYLSKEKSAKRRGLRIRYTCRLLLKRQSYASGLVRLVNLLRRHSSWPPVIWKDVPPQHFKSQSGQYDWVKGPREKGCTAIQNVTEAYQRNVVANELLKDKVAIVRTWNDDVNTWRGHPGDGRDCTHYCNPSNTTWNWMRVVVGMIENIQNSKT